MQNEGASPYDSTFYSRHNAASYASGKAILELLWKYYKPGSVVDVGCGSGNWLKAVRDLGVEDILGLEGDWLNPEICQIPWKKVKQCDLKKPPTIGRKFDLAMSMEVAEHLPAESAKGFVEFMTSLAPVVVFSAACPDQGGTDHLNEQWPMYWAELFRQKNYVTIDAIRPATWARPDVVWWYAQNAIVYAERGVFEGDKGLQALSKLAIPSDESKPLSLVHPCRLDRQLSVRNLVELMPAAVQTAVRRRLKKK